MSGWRAKKERERFRRREQFEEAYKVQVVQGERPAPGQHAPNASELVLLAIVVNRGHYTITDVEVRFTLDGENMAPAVTNERMWSFKDIPEGLHKGEDIAEQRAMTGVLPPWDAGRRSESAEMSVECLKAHHALVRWTDWRDQRWEHRLGKVERIHSDQPWKP